MSAETRVERRGVMLADVEHEAPPARRLLAFAATFLGMFTLAQAALSGPVPVLSPPLVALAVILLSAAGLLIWVRSRWSRALMFIASGLLFLTGAATAFLLSTVPWLGLLVIMLGLDAMLAGVVLGIAQFQPTGRLAAWQKQAMWAMLIAVALLALLTASAGRGPLVAVVAGSTALLIIWLLRPEVA